MKKLIFSLILMLIVSVSFAQFGGIGKTTVTKVVGLQDSLNLKISQAQADVRYPLISDSVAGYTAAEVDDVVSRLDRGKFDNQIKRLTGLNIISPIAASSTLSGAGVLVDGNCYYALYEVLDTITVSTVQFMLSTQGNYVGDNYNGIALMSYNPSTKTYTKIIETVNDPTMWSQAIGVLQTKTFAPQVLIPGFYAISLLYNSSSQTTAPSMSTFGTILSTLNQVYSHYLVGYKNVQTAIPSTETYANMLAGTAFIPGIILK